MVQDKDGTLSTKFPDEVIPKNKKVLDLPVILDNSTSNGNLEKIQISSLNGIGSAHLDGLPYNSRITLEVEPIGNNEESGLYLRTNERAEGGYKLNFLSNQKVVQLGNMSIDSVEGLNDKFSIDIIMTEDIIDVCVNNRRCIVNRCPEQKGDQLWFLSKHGKCNFNNIKIFELI